MVSIQRLRLAKVSDRGHHCEFLVLDLGRHLSPRVSVLLSSSSGIQPFHGTLTQAIPDIPFRHKVRGNSDLVQQLRGPLNQRRLSPHLLRKLRM